MSKTHTVEETSTDQKIKTFFNDYEKRFADGLAGDPQVDNTINAFSDYFVEASPAGVQGGANDEKFKEAIPKGYEFYKSIGTESMKIGSLQITQFDNFHYMARVHWISIYKSKKRIEFDVIYFLQNINDTLQIFAYITGDETAALKEEGLVD